MSAFQEKKLQILLSMHVIVNKIGKQVTVSKHIRTVFRMFMFSVNSIQPLAFQIFLLSITRTSSILKKKKINLAINKPSIDLKIM